jgi:hypothetical protein
VALAIRCSVPVFFRCVLGCRASENRQVVVMKSLWDHQSTYRGLTCGLPVRTVHARRAFSDAPAIVPSNRRCGRPRTEEVLELNRQIRQLKDGGHTYEEIQAITGAHPNTIARHLHGQVLAVTRAGR